MYTKHTKLKNIFYFTVALIATFTLTATSIPPSIIPTRTEGRMNPQQKVSINHPRPVAKAIEMLETKYAAVITYEDPRYMYEGDVLDKTDPEYRRANPSGFRALAPRGGSLEIDFASFPATKRPEDITKAIQAILDSHATKSNVGRFRLKQTGRFFHVIPTEVRDSSGKWISQGSILDTPITFPKQNRTGLKTIELITAVISQSTKMKVAVGMAPWTPLIKLSVNLGSENEPARDILIRVFESLKIDLSWQLFFDPSGKTYFLNLHPVG